MSFIYFSIGMHARNNNPTLRGKRAKIVSPVWLRSMGSAFFALAIILGRAQESLPQSKQSAAPLQTNTSIDSITARLGRDLPALMTAADVPGLSLALLRDGNVAWVRAFGVKDSKSKDPVTNETVFEAASLSKPVFAYAVLKLVDAGQLDLDRPLNQYLPGDYDVGPDPRLSQVTARRVLSHTTGFPNWRGGDPKLKIFFTPGEKFSYSGEGFVYLSKVVEHITGEKLNDFMKRMVFDPVGMTSSSYVWQERYDLLKTSRHNALGEPSAQIKATSNAAASLHTTARDYARFLAAVMNGTGLKPETVKNMLTPQVRVDEGGSDTTARPADKLSSMIAWGLGMGLQTTADGVSFWHWGDNGDAKAYFVVHPRQKVGLVMFANSSNGLSFLPELVDEAIGGEQPAIAWIKYESYKSPKRMLLKNIQAKGAQAALREYREWRKGRATDELLNEQQMNRFGYDLLYGLRRPKDAIEVFKLNVEDHPQSSNTYDSLGEAYMVDGNKEMAIKNYERSVELNPKNADGIEALKKLREGPKQ
jgi:CubicO group peptidase (beta-lactamase class C family)